jgi:hypothetical protein
MGEEKHPVIQVAEARNAAARQVVTLSTGVRARIVPVGASLIDDVTAQVKDPPVPTFHNEDKGRDEENPNDPEYLRQMAEAQRARAVAALDAMVMFGLELTDGLPEDDKWLVKLQFLAKRGQLDLSGFDPDDPLDKEFLYKKYIATGTADLIRIGRTAGLSQGDVAEAVENFPG